MSQPGRLDRSPDGDRWGCEGPGGRGKGKMPSRVCPVQMSPCPATRGSKSTTVLHVEGRAPASLW